MGGLVTNKHERGGAGAQRVPMRRGGVQRWLPRAAGWRVDWMWKQTPKPPAVTFTCPRSVQGPPDPQGLCLVIELHPPPQPFKFYSETSLTESPRLGSN